MANLSNINNVLRVSSNLRVGINTDAASYALEIGGTNSGIKLKNSDATNGRVYSLLSDTSGNFQIYDDAAASGRLVISSGGSATFAGNTTAPKVIVSGSTNNYATAPVVYFDSTSTANPGVRDWAIGPADDDYGNFHIFVGASTGADPVGTAGQVLTITNAGNATFAGNVNISSPGDFYINSGTSYNNKGSIFMSNQRTEIVSDIVNLTANGDTSLNFKTRSGGATASAIFIDEFRNATFAGSVRAENRLDLYNGTKVLQLKNVNNEFTIRNGNSGLVPLTIASSGSSTFAGQVNITSAGSAHFGITNTNVSGSSQQYLQYVGSNGDYVFRNATDSITPLVLAKNNNATFEGNLQSGNFAIGVAPSSFGSGVPTITLQGTAANGRGGAIVFKEQDGTVTTNIYSTDGSDGYGTVINAAQGSFRVSVGALAANKLEINSSGDVGIGTVPETAGPTWRTLFIGASATIVSRQAAAGYDSIFANNYYVNSSNQDRVRTTGPSSRMFLDGNNIRFQISPSTGVGGSPTWSEIMRIDDSGNVGIGDTSPSFPLTISKSSSTGSNGSDVSMRLNLVNPDQTANNWALINFSDGTSQPGSGFMGMQFTDHTLNFGNLVFGTRGLINGNPAYGERMRITSGGNVLIGDFASNGSIDPAQNGFGFQANGLGTASCNFSDTNEMFVFNQRDGLGTTQIDFRNGNVERGKIQWTTSGTTYNTASDYRVKENLKDFNGLNKVSKIKVYDFDWIESKKQDYGVIAHELQEILPLAVTGEKDGKKMQGVDYSKIVPLLVKSIQELKDEIELLKNK